MPTCVLELEDLGADYLEELLTLSDMHDTSPSWSWWTNTSWLPPLRIHFFPWERRYTDAAVSQWHRRTAVPWACILPWSCNSFRIIFCSFAWFVYENTTVKERVVELLEELWYPALHGSNLINSWAFSPRNDIHYYCYRRKQKTKPSVNCVHNMVSI